MKKTMIIILGFALLLTFACSAKQAVQTGPTQPPPPPPPTVEPEVKPTQPLAPPPPPQPPITRQDTIIEPPKKTAPKKAERIAELQATINDIYFEFDKYDLSPADMPTIKKVAEILSSDMSLAIVIEGHCDERGTNEYNLALGDKRASAVKAQLQALGVPSSRIQVISYGEEKPVCTESNETCWAKNRRAHIVIIEAGK